MIQRLRIELAGLSSLLRVGLLVFVLGSGLDLLYHSSPPSLVPFLETFMGPDAHGVHLVIMAGMIVIVLGLIERGIALGRPADAKAGAERKEVREFSPLH